MKIISSIFPARKTWKQKFLRLLLLGFVLYSGILIWAGREFVFSGFLFGRTLLVFTNENEARPCGGFVSAYGVFKFFPPQLQLRDVYTLADPQAKPSEFPLTKVSPVLQFWDLGNTPDVSLCAEQFHQAYEKITSTKISHVLIIDFATLEKIGAMLGEQQFFASLSRSVANLDRHNLEALQNRKNPMKHFARSFFLHSILRPDIPLRTVSLLAERTKHGDIFSPETTEPQRPEMDDFSFLEWNLGGGKSSRYLEKTIEISFREIQPQEWSGTFSFRARHLGGFDEPLSHFWKGVFEIQLPAFLGHDHFFYETKIAPGETFEKTIRFSFQGKLPAFGVFRGRSQKVFARVTVSLFPQQFFGTETGQEKESVFSFAENLRSPRTPFSFLIREDQTKPFITLHEIVAPPFDHQSFLGETFFEGNVFVEVHFNENVSLLDSFQASLEDKNVLDLKTTEHPTFLHAKLLPDQRTLFLSFSRKELLFLEHYRLILSGVSDSWKNVLVPTEKTVLFHAK